MRAALIQFFAPRHEDEDARLQQENLESSRKKKNIGNLLILRFYNYVPFEEGAQNKLQMSPMPSSQIRLRLVSQNFSPINIYLMLKCTKCFSVLKTCTLIY